MPSATSECLQTGQSLRDALALKNRDPEISRVINIKYAISLDRCFIFDFVCTNVDRANARVNDNRYELAIPVSELAHVQVSRVTADFPGYSTVKKPVWFSENTV